MHRNMLTVLLIHFNFGLLLFVSVVWGQHVWQENDFGACLGELKVSELLRLQHSLMKLPERAIESEKESEVKMEKPESDACEGSCPTNKPEAMALVAENRGYAPSSYDDYHPSYHPWQPEEKPSKLQTLFQISITALAFLSFGAYLLCLIVQAIKSKGTTYFHPVATATTTNGNGGVKRIKIYRRSRRWLNDNNNRSQQYPMTSAYATYYNYSYS